MANEKRLIDANVLIRDLTAMKSMYDAISLHGIIKALKEAPTVDAVEVVRCKDCKHYKEHPASKRMCCYVHLLTPHHMREDGFCSYGERRSCNDR